MKIEEIKKIGEIIESLGDKTVDGLMIFLGHNLIVELMGYAVGMTFIYVVYKILRPLVTTGLLEMQAVSAMKKLREILNVGEPGELTNGEIKNIIEKAERLKRESQA